MDYATLEDLTDWLNNYSRACEDLDVLPDATRNFTANKNWKNNQQQKIFLTMRNSQHTEKRITSRMNEVSRNDYVHWKTKTITLDTVQFL